MKTIYFFFFLLSVSFSCKKTNVETNTQAPVVSTKDLVLSITSETAVIGGAVSYNGGGNITARGACWSLSPNPLVTMNHSIETSGVLLGEFSTKITGLDASTTYYVRAYATNSAGTAYGNEISFSTSAPSVYVVGFEYNQNDIEVATLWKNGVAIPLTDGTTGADATSVFVSNSDVYVSGSESDGSYFRARLWKNGYISTLSDLRNSGATSVFVSGDDVYAAGYEGNNAIFWKNGVSNSVTTTPYAAIKSIFVSGTDVYMAGFSNNIARVWKNGIETTYGDGLNQSTANSIFVSGTDVYVAGEDIPFARIWKNSAFTNLGTGLLNSVAATSVFVSEGNVYVAGFEDKVAKVWKNGIVTNLNDGTNRANAVGVYVYKGDVYVAGYEYSGIVPVATLWKNGVPFSLSNGTKIAVARTVFVR